MNYFSREVIRKAKMMPDEIEFIDEEGKLLVDFGVLVLTPEDKHALAYYSIKWKQSLDITFQRMLKQGIKSMKEEKETRENVNSA